MLYRSDSRLSVRSAGVNSSAKHVISESDVNWADVIFAMGRGHKARIMERFRGSELPPIEVLDIPENLSYMDPELQRLLRQAIDPEINALLKAPVEVSPRHQGHPHGSPADRWGVWRA
jgi:predicted protein tyrosine phosphatase